MSSEYSTPYGKIPLNLTIHIKNIHGNLNFYSITHLHAVECNVKIMPHIIYSPSKLQRDVR